MRSIGDGFHEQMVDNSVRAGIGHLEIHRAGYQRDPALLKTLPDLERVKRVVKLGGFVNAAKDFVEIPKVVNGCSDLMVEAFGDKGRHARSAVACPVLPMGAAVEVDAVVEFT